MSHPPFELLEADELSPEVQAHLRDCPRCRVDRRRLRAEEAIGEEEIDAARADIERSLGAATSALGAVWRSSVSGSGSGSPPDRGHAPQEAPLLHGSTDLGRYRLLGLLGHGGAATVFLVEHKELGTRHALKVLDRSTAVERGRLLREGRMQGSLRHPNVLPVTDLIEIGGAPGLVIAFVDGPSLDRLLGLGVLPISQVDALAIDILDGVAAAHAAGLIHRDLKPANVLVDPAGGRLTARVADFGLAKALRDDGSGFRTRTGAVLGTPLYMAPEQLRDARQADARSDVFSLGALLYELATGLRCFGGLDYVDVVRRVTEVSYTPPEAVRPELPARMLATIAACLRADPAERPADAAAVLALWTAGEGVASRPPTPIGEEEADVLSELRPVASLPEGEPRTGTPGGEGRWRPSPGRIAQGIAIVGLIALLAAEVARLSGPPPIHPRFYGIVRDQPGARDPSLSPDGRSLVFSDGTELYLARIEGSQGRILTDAFEPRATSPAWSPDGEHIACVAEEGIWVMGALGEDPRRIVARGFDPAWSPDGTRIAYATEPIEDLFVPPLRAPALRVVEVASGADTELVPASAGPYDPDWSWDGRTLVFSTPEGPASVPAGGGAITSLDLVGHWGPQWLGDGTLLALFGLGEQYGVRQIEADLLGRSRPRDRFTLPHVPRSYDVAPDGRRMVFAVARQTFGALRIPPSGGTPEPATPLDRWLTSAVPSPDGTLLAAARYIDPETLVVRSADGRWHDLVHGDYVRAPTWRPDGTRVTFTADLDGHRGVYEVAPDGSSLRRLSDASIDWMAPPHWSPDGARLAWTDREQASERLVILDPERPWRPRIEALRAEPALAGLTAGPFSPDGARLLARTPQGWWILDAADPGVGRLAGPISASWAAWSDPQTLVIIEGTIVRRWSLSDGPGAPLVDLGVWEPTLQPALSIGSDGAIYVSVQQEERFLLGVDLEE